MSNFICYVLMLWEDPASDWETLVLSSNDGIPDENMQIEWRNNVNCILSHNCEMGGRAEAVKYRMGVV